jgi:signal transduction histidine kinase
MNAQRSLETVIRRTTSRPFRFKFSMLYIGITGAVVYLNGMTGCSQDLPGNAVFGIGILLLVLLALEWFEQNRFREPPSTLAALSLVGARMVLIEGIVALDCSIVSLFLYPMIPYSAYFTLGSRASIGISFFYIALNIWRSWRLDSAWYLDPNAISNMLAFTFVMSFVPLVAHIIRLDDENRQRTEQLLADLEVSHLRLQAYIEQVADLAAAEERNRLARDIHDSLGHYLTAVNIQLEKALVYQERNPDEATQAIREAKQAAAEALRDVRRSVSALREGDAGFSLVDALKKLIEGVEDDHLDVDLHLDGDESIYPRSTLLALYRACQEGLTNVQKHAKASQVELNVELGTQEARLTLRDNGQGFDLEAIEYAMPGPGYGLSGMRERLELLRGQMALQSSSQRGTELTIIVPRLPADLGIQIGEPTRSGE